MKKTLGFDEKTFTKKELNVLKKIWGFDASAPANKRQHNASRAADRMAAVPMWIPSSLLRYVLASEGSSKN